MSISRRKLREGWRYAYDKTVRARRLRSLFIYTSRDAAELAQAEAVAELWRTGRAPGPKSAVGSETVGGLYKRWVTWLHHHRSRRHASEMGGLMARALEHAPEMLTQPATELTLRQIEDWAQTWAADLLDRGKGRGEVNKWIRHSQTAFNAPWGRRRGDKEYAYNPFAHMDRFQVEIQAKYVPTPAEVSAIRLAASGEFQVYLELLIETGARPSEGLNLEWRDVQGGSVILYTKKTATGDRIPRRVLISPEMAHRLSSWRRQQPIKQPVHVFQQTKRPAGHHLIWTSKRHGQACQAAGVDYYPVGCYRHYHAVTYYQDCKDLMAVQRRLGHRSSTTTEHYLQSLLAT